MVQGTLLNMEVDKLCDVLCLFLMEIRKQNGTEYPRETLYEIVLSIQYFMSMNRCNLKLLEHNAFVKMRNMLDNCMKQLSKTGNICECSQAQPIPVEEEEKLWQSGLLGEDTPEQLFNTMLYLIRLHFALCACDEHKNLRCGAYSQFNIRVDDQGQKFLEYTEHQSKNYQGGLKNLHQKPKVVKAYENIDNPEHCIVYLFQK